MNGEKNREDLSGKRILINALVNLGDVVLATSAAALLKKIDPSVHVAMMVRPFAREIVVNNPVIDDVIIFSYKAKQKSYRIMWQMVKTIRHGRYDVCISLDRKLRPALLTFLARIPERVVPERIFDDKPSKVVWLYNRVIPMPRFFLHQPQAENFQTVIRGWLNVNNIHAKPVIGVPTKHNRLNAETLMTRLNPERKHIALCVKGSFPLKNWPKEYFARLIKKLQQRYDADFFIIGAPGDREYADEVISGSMVSVQNFCGDTSLMDLVEVFKHTFLFVSVDTGSLHIAATTDVPIVAMYGCGPSTRWPPMSDNSRVVTTNESCSPCHIQPDACPSNPRPKCQWNITPDMVMNACEDLIRNH